MSHFFRLSTGFLLGLGLLMVVPKASAAIYCVTNVSDLQTALSAAAASFNDDEIRLRQGIYASSQQLVYNSPNPGWAFLTGGWVQQGDNNCAVQNGNAASTVLTGSAMHQVLAMYFLPNAGVSSGPRYGLQNLSIRDGYGDSATFQRGGGLQMASYTDVQVEF